MLIQQTIDALQAAKTQGKPFTDICETVVRGAKQTCQADGVTLYLLSGEHELEFMVLLSDRLDFHMGGASRHKIPFANIPLRDGKGVPNHAMVVTSAANRRRTIRIDDVYQCQQFDFSGAKEFDSLLGYRTQSVLAVPIANNNGCLLGVLQLLNKHDPGNGHVVGFSEQDAHRLEFMATRVSCYLDRNAPAT